VLDDDAYAERWRAEVAFRARGVVLYGHAEMNGAWAHALGGEGGPWPIDVRRGRARVGRRMLEGEDLAVLAYRPGVGPAGVAIVAGTGPAGMRLCDRVPYLSSGVHLPDVTVFRADVLEKGLEGVRLAGFFGEDWSAETGSFAARE
jgi:hypothetical protein